MNGEYTTTSRMVCMVIGLLLMTSFAQFEWFGVVKLIVAIALIGMTVSLA